MPVYWGLNSGVKICFSRWSQSAGAISVALHMITNGGNIEGLFRGAFMVRASQLILEANLT